MMALNFCSSSSFCSARLAVETSVLLDVLSILVSSVLVACFEYIVRPF